MPCDYAEYPPDWKVTRSRILTRAGHKCEWCGAVNYQPHPITGSRVILTVAHLDHDKANWGVEDRRLVALCQRCHLNYDRERHIENRKKNREKKQGILFLQFED